MVPRKKRSADAIGAVPPPTRRSTRTRRPPKGAANGEADDPIAKIHTARDKKAPCRGALDPEAVQDEIVVHRPREIAEAEAEAEAGAAVDTIISADIATASAATAGEDGKNSEDRADGESGGGMAAENAMSGEKADIDMDGEDKIVAYPGSPKAAARTPIKSTAYVAEPADKEEDELAVEQPAIKIVKVSDSARKGRSKYDKPEEMLTNPRSPLANARLRVGDTGSTNMVPQLPCPVFFFLSCSSFRTNRLPQDLLCSANAWDLLGPEERRRVLAKFPDQREILDSGTEEARPDFAALRNNDNFRHDVARYQDNLHKGKHDPEWIRQARDAHRKRELGLYADYLAARFEEDWGMKMPGYEAENGEAEETAQTRPEVELEAEVKVKVEADRSVGNETGQIATEIQQRAPEVPETADKDHEVAGDVKAAAGNHSPMAEQTIEVAANAQPTDEKAGIAADSAQDIMPRAETNSSMANAGVGGA